MILIGDVRKRLKELSDQSVNCCVTSPPYWGLRDYGNDDQIGLEQNPDDFINELVAIFREVKRVLRDDGTLWVNMGDSYSGSGKGTAGNLGLIHNERHLEDKTGGLIPKGTKPKDLIGIPWMLAFALRDDGWYLRQDIIWNKPNPMPESVTDRCTKSHEYIFLLSKSRQYYYDNEAIKEPAIYPFDDRSSRADSRAGTSMNSVGGKTGNEYVPTGTRNKRDVWTVTTKPFRGAHFATFPPDLIEPCILAGCPKGGTVLDPFFGAGTVGLVAQRHDRNWIGIELNPDYASIAETRIQSEANLFTVAI